MSGILTYSLGFLGLLGLFYGGNTLVKGTIKTANSLNLPAHLIAVTIVALGTSAPELVVSVNAVLKNSPDLAWGNVVGSNIANLLLVLGGAALFLNLQDNSKSLRIDVFWMVSSTSLIFVIAIFFNGIYTLLGVFLIVFLTIILFLMAYNTEKNSDHNLVENGLKKSKFPPTLVGLFLTISGILIVLISSEMLISSAIKVSINFGVEESLIGVTIVALGTSLPEISASIAAARKGHADIAIGNVLGSNLFNSLGILGAASIASYPGLLKTPQSFILYDLPVMLFLTIILGGYLFYLKKIDRIFGPVLLIFYGIYIFMNFS